jgi:Leucine-rich repeat (LRR) protein
MKPTPLSISNPNPHANGLKIDNKTVNYVPSDISKSFADLTSLVITNSHLRAISFNDLRYLTKLRHLDLTGNDLMSLPMHLFIHNGELRVFGANKNQIETIGAKVFDNLKMLEFLSLAENVCTTLTAHNMVEVRRIIENISETCMNPSDHQELLEMKKQDSSHSFVIVTLVILEFFMLALFFYNVMKARRSEQDTEELTSEFSYVDLNTRSHIEPIYDEINDLAVKSTSSDIYSLPHDSK